GVAVPLVGLDLGHGQLHAAEDQGVTGAQLQLLGNVFADHRLPGGQLGGGVQPTIGVHTEDGGAGGSCPVVVGPVAGLCTGLGDAQRFGRFHGIALLPGGELIFGDLGFSVGGVLLLGGAEGHSVGVEVGDGGGVLVR